MFLRGDNTWATPTASLFADDSIAIAKLVKGSPGQYLKMDGANVSWETVSPGSAGGANTIHMNDNVNLSFGDSTTPDLKIYHNGTHSSIVNLTGNLHFAGQNVRVTNANFGETFISCDVSSAVKLYGWGSSSAFFETTANGAKTTGTLEITEDLYIGTSTTLFGQDKKVQIASTGADAAVFLARFSETNGVAAYLHFAKSSSGTLGANGLVVDGELLGRIYFSGNDGTGTQSAAFIESYVDGTAAATRMPGSLVFKTSKNIAGGVNPETALTLDSSQNATFAGHISLPDAKRLKLGGSDDLQIYHIGGANSYISNFSNNLYIQTPNSVEIGSTDSNGSAVETSATFLRGGASALYWDDVAKLETKSNGASVLGGNLAVHAATNNHASIHVRPNGTGIYASFLGYSSDGTKSCGLTTAYGTNVYLDSNTNGTIDIRSTGTGAISFQNNGSTTLTLDSSNNATFAGDVSIGGSINEKIHDETFDAASENIDPAKGTIQRITLSQAGHTIGFTNMTNGESVLLMIEDGSSGTVTTWTGVTWVTGNAPTLATTGYSLIEVWKAKNAADTDTVFACHVGDVA